VLNCAATEQRLAVACCQVPEAKTCNLNPAIPTNCGKALQANSKTTKIGRMFLSTSWDLSSRYRVAMSEAAELQLRNRRRSGSVRVF
jgi:hypothetical protein